jgi:hypothetical protein
MFQIFFISNSMASSPNHAARWQHEMTHAANPQARTPDRDRDAGTEQGDDARLRPAEVKITRVEKDFVDTGYRRIGERVHAVDWAASASCPVLQCRLI